MKLDEDKNVFAIARTIILRLCVDSDFEMFWDGLGNKQQEGIINEIAATIEKEVGR